MCVPTERIIRAILTFPLLLNPTVVYKKGADLGSLEDSHVCGGTHCSLVNHSFAGSTPQRVLLGAADVPVDPDLSERTRVPDPRGDLHRSPREIRCGVCSQFVNHDLIPEEFRMKSRSGDV